MVCGAVLGVLVLLFLGLFGHDVFELGPETLDLAELVGDLGEVS